MSELNDLLVDGVREIEESLGAVITWNGRRYPVVPGSAVRGKDLGAGGFKLRADLSLVARVAVFPDPPGPPQAKQVIGYLGDSYRVDMVEKMPGGALVRFECNDPNQGA